MFVPSSAYTVGAELSYLGVGREGNPNTAQPYEKGIEEMYIIESLSA